VPVDGVEVARARKAVPTFQLGSGREALAPLRAAALQDRAAGACRHPRAESVPALPASNVRLESAFHRAEKEAGGNAPAPAGHPASIEKGPRPTGLEPSGRGDTSAGVRKLWALRNPQAESRMVPGFQPPFHSCGDRCGKAEKPCSLGVFSAQSRMFSSVERLRRRCYDRHFPESGGGSNNQACNALLN
jgi:hypothetical protein